MHKPQNVNCKDNIPYLKILERKQEGKLHLRLIIAESTFTQFSYISSVFSKYI